MPPSQETKGVQGICHLLADAARQHGQPLTRPEAAAWAVKMALVVARATSPSPADPGAALARFLTANGARTDVADRTALPGAPCETCVASQILPIHVAADAVALAALLGCDAGAAFQWASRLGAIVLSHPSTDLASTPTDALAALVLREYVAPRRAARCDLEAGAA